ncbi:MAG TPA: glucose-6-phosphate isomerase [Pirellulaceae bacterium]|jgi:glucose-6-phosphate isomerase|nr:glucose-6-phosphate isomerase [Pirellulaceae bacterium]
MSKSSPGLVYDPSGVFLPQRGLAPSDLDAVREPLLAARKEMLETDLSLWSSGGAVPAAKQPLDAGFHRLPERMLESYRKDRDKSELGRILRVAAKLREEVDRVVLLGIGGSYMGAKALMEACCDPYWNERSRAHRGMYPRLYFEGNNVDNDSSSALLDLLQSGPKDSVEGAWGLAVISKSGGTLETAIAFRQYLRALEQSVGGDKEKLARRVVPVTGTSGKLFDLSKAIGCPEIFEVPDGVGGRFSILSAVGLLPAALLGLDVLRLLEGAVQMNDRFASEAPGENPVLDYVAVCRQMEVLRGADTRVLSVWSKSLESTGLWYDQLLAESLGKHEQGALPLTVVNTRDLHSRAQQHQEGKRDKLFTNVILENWKWDPLPVGKSERNQDGLNDLADKTLPEVMRAAIQGTNEAYRLDGRPTADIRLPKADESSLGQFFQMMMLATVLEGRLIGINPYGQPGVEAYKKQMNAALGRK